MYPLLNSMRHARKINPAPFQNKSGALLSLGAALLLAGCPEPEQQEAAATGSTLCVADFEMCVNPIFDAVISGRTGQTTCSASGCHDQASGSGGAFKIFPSAPPDSTQIMANFFAAKAFANLDDPAESKLLLEPLQGTSSIAGTHTGGDIFPDGGDACYAAIRDWIALRVSEETSESCGACTPPAVTSCGY
ncbi:hypothetical protein BH24PSE2_BH24PSE2_17820 [soil metagenome]